MPQLSDIPNKKNVFKKKAYRAYKTEENTKNNILNENIPDKNSSSLRLDNEDKANITSYLGETVLIDHKKCRPWEFADRKDYEMGNIEELANSIKSNGQEVPALLRKLPFSDGEIEFEVIYGHRRWKACTLINKPLKAKIKNLDNKEAAVAQILENYNRENLSDYSKSKNYSKLLKENTFSSKTELAAYVGIPRTTVNNIMAFSDIPEKLITSLITPEKLPTRTAVKLASLCKNITILELEKLCDIAPLIMSGSIPFKKIDLSLFNKDKSKPSLSLPKEKQVFSNEMNVKLFTSGLNQNKAPSLTFHKIVIDNNLVPEIEALVHDFLKKKT